MAPAAMTEATDERMSELKPRPFLVGLVGRGIQLSRTPAMHEAEGSAQGFAYVYRLLDVDRMGSRAPDLADIVTFAARFGFDGLNVTFPYKQEIIPLLDELSDAAAMLGSVNTVVLRDGRRVGHNTDLWGFTESFRREMVAASRKLVVLLGAGGAGAAVAHALLDCGTEKVMISDIEPDRAETLCQRLALRYGAERVARSSDLARATAQADGIVNASPVGMAKLPGIPLDPALLRPQCWVADIVYFPLETELLRAARKLGCLTLSGEGMAVYQAARAFELLTGHAADADRMRTTFTRFRHADDPERAARPEATG